MQGSGCARHCGGAVRLGLGCAADRTARARAALLEQAALAPVGVAAGGGGVAAEAAPRRGRRSRPAASGGGSRGGEGGAAAVVDALQVGAGGGWRAPGSEPRRCARPCARAAVTGARHCADPRRPSCHWRPRPCRRARTRPSRPSQAAGRGSRARGWAPPPPCRCRSCPATRPRGARRWSTRTRHGGAPCLLVRDACACVGPATTCPARGRLGCCPSRRRVPPRSARACCCPRGPRRRRGWPARTGAASRRSARASWSCCSGTLHSSTRACSHVAARHRLRCAGVSP